MRCEENGIERRLTKIKDPWTNDQAERMNRVFGLDPGIKDATVRRFHYDNHDQLRHLHAAFINDYNVGRRLKTLRGQRPCAFVVKCWTSKPERVTLNPNHQMLGLKRPCRLDKLSISNLGHAVMTNSSIDLFETVEVFECDDVIQFRITGFQKDDNDVFHVNAALFINDAEWKKADLVSFSPFGALMSAQNWIGNNLRYYRKNHPSCDGPIPLDDYIPLPKGQRETWDEN
jgi:hypothetical protein